MDDPFFRSQRHPSGWGTHSSYLEDLSRSYGKPLGPQLAARDSESFKKAVAFRQREKQHYSRLEAEHKHMRDEYGALERDFDTLSEQLSKMEALLAKKNAVPTRIDSDRRDDPAPVEPAQPSEPSKDIGGELPGAVLPADVPDPRGSSGEDDAQGRQTGGDDTAGSVQQPEEPVHEGGE